MSLVKPVLRYTLDDDADPSPSARAGVAEEDEEAARADAAMLVQELSVVLGLPPTTIARASTLLHRFFCVRSMVDYEVVDAVQAVVMLASKLDDREKKVHEIINITNCLMHKAYDNPPVLYPTDASFQRKRDRIVKAEGQILRDLGYHLQVEDPYKFVVFYLYEVLGEDMGMLQCAWSYMSDSFLTDACVRFEPYEIALGCIYLALRKMGKRYPEDPHPWWSLFDITTPRLIAVVQKISRAYLTRPRPLPRTSRRSSRVDAASAAAAGASNSATPSPTPPVGSPPASTGEPAALRVSKVVADGA